MKKNIYVGLLSVSMLSILSANAQEVEGTTPKINTIENQFDELISKSNTYENYKVIDRNKLSVLQKNISDSIRAAKRDAVSQQNVISQHESEIQSLNGNITTLQAELDQTRDEKDSFSFFGLLMPKTTYSAIMWALVVGLGGLLGFYIFRFGKSNSVTQKSLSDLNELQEEYENYRKSAIEREQKVRRQLQDEINKNKDLK